MASRSVSVTSLWVDANVEFVDAYLAEVARRHDEPVASFDCDFDRLRVRRVEPGSPAVS